MGVVRSAFKPEFLNRLDEIVLFDALGTEELAQIVDINLSRLNARLADRRITVAGDRRGQGVAGPDRLRPGLRRPAAAPADPDHDRGPAGPPGAVRRGARGRHGHLRRRPQAPTACGSCSRRPSRPPSDTCCCPYTYLRLNRRAPSRNIHDSRSPPCVCVRSDLPLSGLLLAAGLTLTGSLAGRGRRRRLRPRRGSDFNGDGRSDTVVADPYATVNGQAQAGRVIVLYGDADGLIGEGARGIVSQGQSERWRCARGRGPVRLRPRGRRSRLRRLHRPGRRHPVRGHQRPGRLRLRADHLGLGRRPGQRRRLPEGHPERLPERRHRRGRPVRLRGRRAGGRRPGRHPGARTRTRVAIGVPGGNIGGQNDSGWVGVLHAFDGGNVADRHQPELDRRPRRGRGR